MNQQSRDRIRYLLTLLKAENVSERDRQSAYEQLADSTEELLLAYETLQEQITQADLDEAKDADARADAWG